LAVTNETTGALTITLDESETVNLVPRSTLRYDIQALIGGVVTTKTSGVCNVIADITQATS